MQQSPQSDAALTAVEDSPFLNQERDKNRFQIEQEMARRLCLASPYYLGKTILGYDRFGPSQVNWDKWVRENIDLTCTTPGKFLVLQPRETFKTTYFTVTLCICLILNNPNISILLANERESNVKDILKEIKHHFEANEKLRALFGDYVSRDCWAAESITVSKKTQNQKEPSIWVTGIGSAITSKHPDVIICDDIAGKKDKESEAGRQQTLSFFQDTWDLLKKDTGVFLMLGTRKHINDIYWHIKDNLNEQLKQNKIPGFKVLETPAHEGGRPDGKLNFPDILTQEKLNELRVVKAETDGVDFATYYAEYELMPLDDKTQIFKTLHFADHNGMKFSAFSQWTDPSLGENKDSDYSAVIVIGRIAEGEHKGKGMVITASIDRRSPTKIIKDHNRIYRENYAQFPDTENQAAIEQNGFAGLKEFAQADSLADTDKVPVPTRAIANTENKDIRIKSMEPAITQGIILFRADWMSAPENYRLLVEQLRNYPQSKKDGPDALQCAWRMLNKRGTQVR